MDREDVGEERRKEKEEGGEETSKESGGARLFPCQRALTNQ